MRALHVNVTGFMAAVETLRDRSLCDRAFAVAPEGSPRAKILDASRRAVQEGIEPGMGLAEAKRILPSLEVLPPDWDSYRRMDRALQSMAEAYSPSVENDCGGHVYLDLAGTRRLWGPYVDTAVRIKNEIAERLGLGCTVGLSANKLVSKVGTRCVRPGGLVSVREGDEEAFLAGQDIGLLPGLSRADTRILESAGFRDMGSVARLADSEAFNLFGRQGPALRDRARGIDPEPIRASEAGARALSESLVFPSDTVDIRLVRDSFVALAERALIRLRAESLKAGRLVLSLRYSDDVPSRVSRKLPRPMDLDLDLAGIIDGLVDRVFSRRIRARSLGLCLLELVPAKTVPDLLGLDAEAERLMRAVDRSRARFGPGALSLGAAFSARRLIHA